MSDLTESKISRILREIDDATINYEYTDAHTVSSSAFCAQYVVAKHKLISVYLKYIDKPISFRGTFNSEKTNFEKVLKTRLKQIMVQKAHNILTRDNIQSNIKKYLEDSILNVSNLSKTVFIKGLNDVFKLRDISRRSLNNYVFDDINKSILSFKTYVLSDPKRKCFNLCINPTEYIKIEESDAEQACAAAGVSLLRHNAYARVHKAFRIMLDKKNDSTNRNNATLLCGSSCASEIALILWDSNRVFDCVFQIDSIKEADEGKTETKILKRNSLGVNEGFKHPDYSQIMFEFFNKMKTESELKAISCSFFNKASCRNGDDNLLLLEISISYRNHVLNDIIKETFSFLFHPRCRHLYVVSEIDVMEGWIALELSLKKIGIPDVKMQTEIASLESTAHSLNIIKNILMYMTAQEFGIVLKCLNFKCFDFETDMKQYTSAAFSTMTGGYHTHTTNGFVAATPFL